MVLKTARLDPGDAAMLNEPPQLRLSRLRREATRVGRQPEWGGSQSGEATRVGRQPEWQPERRIRDNQGRPVEIARGASETIKGDQWRSHLLDEQPALPRSLWLSKAQGSVCAT